MSTEQQWAPCWYHRTNDLRLQQKNAVKCIFGSVGWQKTLMRLLWYVQCYHELCNSANDVAAFIYSKLMASMLATFVRCEFLFRAIFQFKHINLEALRCGAPKLIVFSVLSQVQQFWVGQRWYNELYHVFHNKCNVVDFIYIFSIFHLNNVVSAWKFRLRCSHFPRYKSHPSEWLHPCKASTAIIKKQCLRTKQTLVTIRALKWNK